MNLRRLSAMLTVFLLALATSRPRAVMSAPDSTQDQKLDGIVRACGGPYRIAMISQINSGNTTTYVNARAGKLEDVTRQIYTVCEADQILTTLAELTSSVNQTEDQFHKSFGNNVSSQLAPRTLTQEQREIVKNKLQVESGKDIETQIQRLTTDANDLQKELNQPQ